MALLDRLKILLRQGSSFALLSALVTMLGLFAAVLTGYRDRDRAAQQSFQADMNRTLVIRQEEQIQRADRELGELRATNEAIMKSLGQVRTTGRPISLSSLDPKSQQRLDLIEQSQSKLDARMSVLESSLMISPEKAVAVPMLKQQLDSLQDRTHNDLDGIRGEIGRLFTLTQWFIGLMFTIALGMFGLSFNLRKASATAGDKSKD